MTDLPPPTSALPPAVDVIVLNWNGQHFLSECLPALAAQTYPRFEVMVVDNGSTDGSLEWLAETWPGVKVLALGTNLGFSAANNRGIHATHAPWLVILNNDTVPEPGWLAALIAAGESNPRIGAVASHQVFYDRPQMVNSAGIAVDPAGIAWDGLGGTRLPERAALATAALRPVFGASAGAGLYRRAALWDVGESVRPDQPTEIFDESFFMYLEDVDLAWRLRLRNWTCVLAPLALIRHHGSATSGEGSPFKLRLLARNKMWSVLKNYPFWPLLAYLPIILAYDLASAPYRLFVQGKTAPFTGRFEAIGGLPTVLRRRRAIQARRTADWRTIRAALANLDPPWAVLSRYRHIGAAPTDVPDILSDP